MSSEQWKECKLKDITSLITKGTTPSMIGANFTTNGIKFIKSECILENSRLLDSSKYTFISMETHERLKRSQIIENDNDEIGLTNVKIKKEKLSDAEEELNQEIIFFIRFFFFAFFSIFFL